MQNITIIKPASRKGLLDFKELIEYWDLMYFFTVRGLKAKYAQSVLGVGWAIIQPLFLTTIFFVVFGKIAKVSSDGVPYLLFSLAGIVPWTFFSTVINESSNSLVANSNMISKVYFPRIIIPLSAAFSKVLDFGISFCILIALLLYYQRIPDMKVFFLPLVLIMLMGFTLSLALLFSAMAVKYRDIKHIVPFGVQIVLYATPIAYPSSAIPDQLKYFFLLNPLVGIVEAFRSCAINSGPFPTLEFMSSSLLTCILLIFSLYYFNKSQRSFADLA